jgi:hypothetical protein
MSKSSGATETAAGATPASEHVRWYRSRPPARYAAAARGLWWTGQSALFLGVFTAITGVPAFLLTYVGIAVIAMGQMSSNAAQSAWFAYGCFATSIAGPLLVADVMFKGRADVIDAIADTSRRRWFTLGSYALLTIVTAGIALVCTVALLWFWWVTGWGVQSWAEHNL